MSLSLNRLPLSRALLAVEGLRTMLKIDRCLVAGSIRRKLETVGDIELVVACPPKEEEDHLLGRILEHFRAPGPPQPAKVADAGLFGGPPVMVAQAPKVGIVIKGAKPYFKYCQLTLWLTGTPKASVNVDIWRFDPGETGNRGWIELTRTGPPDFSHRCLARWKKVSNGGFSEHGYPHTAAGERLAVPTEEAAFELLQWRYIEPENRR